MKGKVKKLINLNSKVQQGDKDKIGKQHKLGKLTARERIDGKATLF